MKQFSAFHGSIKWAYYKNENIFTSFKVGFMEENKKKNEKKLRKKNGKNSLRKTMFVNLFLTLN